MTETTVNAPSHIHGEGWGSSHVWKRDITDYFGGGMGTRYFCSGCGECFVHIYDAIPDIFAAMQHEGVAEVCEPRA